MQPTTTSLDGLRPLAVAAAGFTLFLLATCWPEPRHYSGLWLLLPEWIMQRKVSPLTASIGALVPPLACFACLLLFHVRKTISRRGVLIITRTSATVAFIDFLISPILIGGLLGQGPGFAAYFLVFSSLFAWTLLLSAIAKGNTIGGTRSRRLMTWAPTVFIVAVSVWSVLAGTIASAQARSIAAGRPYCISGKIAVRPQGTNLFTDQTRTAHIGTGHALLIVVDERDLRRYWIWSIPRMSWVADDGGNPTLCQPEHNFLSQLPWL